MKKVLFTATVDSHILHFHVPYLKYFKEQGYEVHVATNGDKEIPYCDKKHIISFERSPYKLNNIKAIINLKKIIMREKYDIIHCHTPMGSVVTRIAAKKARKKYGTRVIYTAHGFHFYKGAPMLNWLLFYPIEKILSRYTDTLITINNEDYELAKKKMKAKRIEYVPGVGIDESKFNFEMTEEEKLELRKSLGLSKDDFVMINIARIDKNKNQILLIETLKELLLIDNKYHLLLVGPDEMNGYCEKLVQKLGIENNVHFLGYRSDTVKLFKISNLALSVSKREGLGLGVVEAMYSGIPVIASKNRGHIDIITDGVNGYLIDVKFGVKEIKEKINYISDSKIIFEKLDNRYFLSNVLNKMHFIYFNLISSIR